MNKSCPACDKKHILSFNFGPLLRCADCGFEGYPEVFETNSGPTWTPVETVFTLFLMALAAIIAYGILGG